MIVFLSISGSGSFDSGFFLLFVSVFLGCVIDIFTICLCCNFKFLRSFVNKH